MELSLSPCWQNIEGAHTDGNEAFTVPQPKCYCTNASAECHGITKGTGLSGPQPMIVAMLNDRGFDVPHSAISSCTFFHVGIGFVSHIADFCLLNRITSSLIPLKITLVALEWIAQSKWSLVCWTIYQVLTARHFSLWGFLLWVMLVLFAKVTVDWKFCGWWNQGCVDTASPFKAATLQFGTFLRKPSTRRHWVELHTIRSWGIASHHDVKK